MKRLPLPYLIAITILALAGLLVMQVFWMKNAIHTNRAQFAHRAGMMLDDVLEELKLHNDTSLQNFPSHKFTGSHSLPSGTIFDVVDTVLLDTLIAKYIEYHMLDSLYSYAVRRTQGDSVVYMCRPEVWKLTAAEPYKICLSCLWKEDYYHLAIRFPNEHHVALLDLLGWLALSVSLMVVVVAIFFFVILGLLRQKRLQDMKSDFINNMTHEFKTPLSAISLAAEVIRDSMPEEDKKLRRYAHIIFEENKRVQSQVEKVLTIARMEKNLVASKSEIIDVHTDIRKAVALFCIEHCTSPAEIDYRFEALQSAIRIDAAHFRSIVSNIIDNAIKYCKTEPHITIATRNENNLVVITFKDNGIGIPRKYHSKIFDRFYRVPTGNLHDRKGFGLGLYNVYKFTSMYRGRVSVTSVVTEGSEFVLRFPVVS